MSVSSILSQTSSNVSSLDIGKLTKDYKKASLGVVENAKFDSRADLQDAGLDRQYDQLQAKLARVEIYDITSSLAQSKITSKKLALQDIRAIITKFQADSSNIAEIAPTKEELANEALKNIVSILNRKEDGKYIFGGKNNNQPPVQLDITTLTLDNIDDFTNVVPSENVTKISETYQVDLNMVNATNVQDLIKALITYKEVDGEPGRIQTQTAIESGLKNHAKLETSVEIALKEIDSAQKENVATKASARQEIVSDFTMNVLESTNNMKSAMTSLLTSFSIAMADRRVMDKIMDGTNI